MNSEYIPMLQYVCYNNNHASTGLNFILLEPHSMSEFCHSNWHQDKQIAKVSMVRSQFILFLERFIEVFTKCTYFIMTQFIICFPYRSSNACYVLKAEETSAGKEVKARKQKAREMNYAKLNA